MARLLRPCRASLVVPSLLLWVLAKTFSLRHRMTVDQNRTLGAGRDSSGHHEHGRAQRFSKRGDRGDATSLFSSGAGGTV